jgi:hypothetical protein
MYKTFLIGLPPLNYRAPAAEYAKKAQPGHIIDEGGNLSLFCHVAKLQLYAGLQKANPMIILILFLNHHGI